MPRKTSTPERGPSPQRGYNTNLASEFYVLSMLYRFGLDASLTLGNKKSVDISVVLEPGRVITIDVKAVKAKMDWLMGNPPKGAMAGHFVVLVSYEGGFDDHATVPRCWIFSHEEILPLVKKAGGQGGMHYLSRSRILTEFGDHEGAWQRLSNRPA